MTATQQPLPESADMVVLGSGVGGLTAALTGALEGLSVLVLEHLPVIGGTSARSSGTVWVPDNQYMRADGQTGDAAQALAYLDALTGALAPRQMREVFVETAPAMQSDLEDRAGIGFRPFTGAPDYRQDKPGAAAGWRALEPLPFDGRTLGDWFGRLAPPLPEMMVFGGMMVTRAEAAELLRADRSFDAARKGAVLVGRFLVDRLRYGRGTRLVLGNALVGRLLKACLDRGVQVATNVETSELAAEDGRVAGVVTTQGRVSANRAVVLAGGGFPANADWRAEHLPKPVADLSPASPGARGRTLEMGLVVGAVLGPAGLDNALWFPSSVMQRLDGSTAVWPHIVLDRAKPGSLVVDGSGRRFVNEAVSYHEFVRGMYRAGAVPCWMICDRAFIRTYGLGLIRPRTPSLAKFIANGYLKKAHDPVGLADVIGVPGETLAEAVARFNGFARTGKDTDFGRGETIYDRAGGDPEHGPNPCLGPVGSGPLYAVQLWPTPLGTSRGIQTDADARALDADGKPIEGLYVCGNDMHSAFGGEYPGAGAQLGQAMTFAWRAARHAAGTGA